MLDLHRGMTIETKDEQAGKGQGLGFLLVSPTIILPYVTPLCNKLLRSLDYSSDDRLSEPSKTRSGRETLKLILWDDIRIQGLRSRISGVGFRI